MKKAGPASFRPARLEGRQSMPAKRYFKNYRMIEEPDGKGGTRKTLKYFGDYHYCTLEDQAFKRQRILFISLAVAADLIYLIGFTRNIPGNRSGIGAAAGLLTAIPLFFLTLGAIHNLTKGQNLTENDYRESRLYMRYGANGAAALMTVTFLVNLVNLILNSGDGRRTTYFAALVSFAITTAVGIFLGRAEKQTPFVLIQGSGSDDNPAEASEREQHPYSAKASSTSEYHEGLRDYLKRKKETENQNE